MLWFIICQPWSAVLKITFSKPSLAFVSKTFIFSFTYVYWLLSVLFFLKKLLHIPLVYKDAKTNNSACCKFSFSFFFSLWFSCTKHVMLPLEIESFNVYTSIVLWLCKIFQTQPPFIWNGVKRNKQATQHSLNVGIVWAEALTEWL